MNNGNNGVFARPAPVIALDVDGNGSVRDAAQ